MLGTNVLFVGILGSWFLSMIFYYIIIKWRGDRLPPGSIKIESSDSVDLSPGTSWSKFGILIAMTGNRLAVIAILLISLFNL